MKIIAKSAIRHKVMQVTQGVSLFFIATFAVASSDNFKIGYVDVAKIFATSKPAIAMQAELKAKLEPQQTELKGLNDKLASLREKIQGIEKTAPSMDKLSATNRASLEKLGTQFQQTQMLFQQKYMSFQQNSQKIQDYASGLLLAKVNEILKKISDKGNYDLVLTSNQMVYAKAKYDLTDQLIEDLKTVDSDKLLKQLKQAEVNIESATKNSLTGNADGVKTVAKSNKKA